MTTVNIPNLASKLQVRLAALGDRANDPTTYDAIQRCIAGFMNAPNDIDKPTAQLAELHESRAKLLAAQAAIEQLIEAQPDYREIRDARARSLAWGRRLDLDASRGAIVRGVEYFGGVPAVPNALKSLLGVTTESDGRELPVWHGSLPEIDERIKRVTEKRDRAQRALDGWISQAEELSRERVTS